MWRRSGRTVLARAAQLQVAAARNPRPTDRTLVAWWSRGERLENLRSELRLGMKPSTKRYLLPIASWMRLTRRESRGERLENFCNAMLPASLQLQASGSHVGSRDRFKLSKLAEHSSSS